MNSECVRYDVAISFAGEDRNVVRKFAAELLKSGARVFYDEYERDELWGENLYPILHSVYARESRFVVIFISKHYLKKKWTKKERAAAQDGALERGDSPFILPIRIDDTELPGLPSTLAYLPITMGPEKLCRALLKKLGNSFARAYSESNPRYGGTETKLITKSYVIDASETLAERVGELMIEGGLVTFPEVSSGGIVVVPSINRWPLGTYSKSALMKAMKQPDEMIQCDSGGVILETTGTKIDGIVVRLDPNGIVRTAMSYDTFGGSTEYELTSDRIGRLYERKIDLHDLVEEKLALGYLVVFPTLPNGLSPKLSRWPVEGEAELIAEALAEAQSVEKQDAGFVVTYTEMSGTQISLHLSDWGLVECGETAWMGTA